MVTEGLGLHKEVLLLLLISPLSERYLKSINVQRLSQRHLLCCAELKDFSFLKVGSHSQDVKGFRAVCTPKVPKYLKLTKQHLLFLPGEEQKNSKHLPR